MTMTDTRPASRSGPLRYWAFDTRGNVIRVCLTVCLLTALASLLLGQDSNWDLRNYHLYNGWAALHGRLSIDLMPAQLQSYFVPWLDAGYYLLAVKDSPMLAAVVLGALHGLAFAAVTAVAWLVLEGDSRRAWLVPLLGLTSCLCSGVFLAELGDSMGDNTTAPLVIGALALTLRAARVDTARCWLLAGLLLGLALAFKLTNTPYALGLGVAALAMPGCWARRLRRAALMTLAAIVVFAFIAGPWFYLVWKEFGNPLFPALNQWFHSPLAASAPYNDPTALPKNALQILTWPLLITANPGRIGEKFLYQLVWGTLYLLTILVIVQTVLRRAGHGWSGLSAPNQRVARMLVVFVAVSFVAWMSIFSLHRYLVPLELVAPLALWLLARRTLPAASAGKWAAGLIAACVATGCCAAFAMIKHNYWSHERWTRRGFAVEAPHMEQPEKATVLIVGNEPQAWRIPFLPRQASYIGIGTNLEDTLNSPPGYDERIRQIVAHRGGTVYALFPGAQENASCQCALSWLLWVPRGGIDDQNRALTDTAEARLRNHGWQLQRESCTVHASYIGRGNYPFHWCKVTRLP